MQTIYYHKEEYENRPEVIEHIEKLKRYKPNLTVIDIGASWNPIKSAHLTHTFDMNVFNNTEKDLRQVKSFKGNLNDYEDWMQLFEYVKEHGKFDFCNCTHTLEDIAYPQAALKYIPRIAKEGFIAVPSVFWELERRQPFRGGVHHRWIFTNRNNVLYGLPKLPIVEYIRKFAENEEFIKNNSHLELRMWWKDTISFEIANNDYMGPTFENVARLNHEIL